MVRGRAGGRAVWCLSAALVLVGGCRHSTVKPTPDRSYFTIRPVTRESPPPCTAPALAGQENGQVVRCFELGPAGVDAGDVASAAIVTDPRTAAEAVQFGLSPQGTERFNALAGTVGVGAEVAIVVDGLVVNAVRIETTQFPGKGVVTGLDTEQAHRLVERLNGASAGTGR